MDRRRLFMAGLLIAAGGTVPAHGAPPAAEPCAADARERIEWRLHGHPAKPVAIATRRPVSQPVCSGVARNDARDTPRSERSGS